MAAKDSGEDGQEFHFARIPPLTDLSGWKHNLEHFYSLHAPDIDRYQPKAETWGTLYYRFSQFEQAWKESASKLIRPQEGDAVWMQFPDGWAWWLLPRAYCSDESAAMGHCGNEPMKGRSDVQILSLRRPVRKGKETLWEPHCTFILHEGGALGEMKGRGNEKPTKAYHKYIIPLLKDPRITSIVGGGYMPANNFHFSDLTEEQRAEVNAANPSIGMLVRDYYNYNGMDEALAARIKTLLDLDSATYDSSYGFILRKWDTEEDFVEDCGDRDALKALRFVEGGESNYDDPSMDDLLELVNGLEEEYLTNLGRKLQLDNQAFIEKEYANFDPSDRAQVKAALGDLYDAYVEPAKRKYDEDRRDMLKALENKERLPAEELKQREEQLRTMNEWDDVWKKVPAIGTLWEAYMSGPPEPQAVRENLYSAMETELQESGTERYRGAYVQVLDEDTAVGLARPPRTASAARVFPPSRASPWTTAGTSGTARRRTGCCGIGSPAPRGARSTSARSGCSRSQRTRRRRREGA